MPPFTGGNSARRLRRPGIGTAVGGRHVLGANDRVRIGFIALGNRGDQVLDAFLKHPDVEVVASSDLYQPYLGFAGQKAGGRLRGTHETA